MAIGLLSAVFALTTESASNTTPVDFSAYDFTVAPAGVLATLEFDSSSDRLYSIARGENLIPNDWNIITADLPGTTHSGLTAQLRVEWCDAGHTKFRFQIRLCRDNATAVTTDEFVLIDNLRLLKMQA